MRKYAIYSTLLLLLAMATAQPLRLHVLANSDSRYDQSVKLMVRDAVISEANAILGQTQDRKQAKMLLMQQAPVLQQAANNVLSAQGLPYGAYLQWGWSDFPDKTYGDKLYPAGRYEALRIVLGDGQGQNWWCVMYPPLCIGDMQPGENVQFKSAILEMFHITLDEEEEKNA